MYDTITYNIETTFASLTVDVELYSGEKGDYMTPGEAPTFFIQNAFGHRIDEDGYETEEFIEMKDMSPDEIIEVNNMIDGMAERALDNFYEECRGYH